MRPGQETPDKEEESIERTRRYVASMRPGQETPDKFETVVMERQRDKASMRPGQETPDKRPQGPLSGLPTTGFNEAGARNPG